MQMWFYLVCISFCISTLYAKDMDTQSGHTLDIKSIDMTSTNTSTVDASLIDMLSDTVPITLEDFSIATTHDIILRSYEKVINCFLTTDDINLNVQNPEGETILHRAVLHNDFISVRQLIKLGINIHIQTQKGMSALLYALLTKHFEIADYLIQHGAKINSREYVMMLHAAKQIDNGNKIIMYYDAYYP